jgi:hypothetical protein
MIAIITVIVVKSESANGGENKSAINCMEYGK